MKGVRVTDWTLEGDREVEMPSITLRPIGITTELGQGRPRMFLIITI